MPPFILCDPTIRARLQGLCWEDVTEGCAVGNLTVSSNHRGNLLFCYREAGSALHGDKGRKRHEPKA